MQLKKVLPPRYTCAARVHRGTQIEIDVATLESIEPTRPLPALGNGSTYAPPAPSIAVETELLDADEYEVRPCVTFGP